MSKRTRIPSPTPGPRWIPSVIRTIGPRLLLVSTGCALLLLIGGSSYVLSRTTPTLSQPAANKQTALQATSSTQAHSVTLDVTTGTVVASSNYSAGADSSTATSAATSLVTTTQPVAPANASPLNAPAQTVGAPVQPTLDTVTKAIIMPLQGLSGLTQHLLGGL